MPTPKELELSRQVVELQQEKDQLEHKLLSQIHDLEAQIHKCIRSLNFLGSVRELLADLLLCVHVC